MNKYPANTLLQKAFIESSVEKLPPHKAIFIDESASCHAALELMVAEKIGCLLVKRAGQKLSGIFTERDALLKFGATNLDLKATQIGQFMTASPQTLKYHASVAKAVYFMSVGGYRHIPIVLRDGSYSVISATDFIRFIFQKVSARAHKQEEAAAVIQLGNAVDTFFDGELSALSPSKAEIVPATTPSQEVISLMVKKRIGCVVIGNQEKLTIQGIFTERDALKRFLLNRTKVANNSISEIMTKSPTTLQATTSVLYALDVMTQGVFRHIPVVDFSEKLVGMLSIKNFLAVVGDDIVSSLTSPK